MVDNDKSWGVSQPASLCLSPHAASRPATWRTTPPTKPTNPAAFKLIHTFIPYIDTVNLNPSLCGYPERRRKKCRDDEPKTANQRAILTRENPQRQTLKGNLGDVAILWSLGSLISQ